jgi:VCBS repeat protein
MSKLLFAMTGVAAIAFAVAFDPPLSSDSLPIGTTVLRFPVGNAPGSVEIGDMNNDGKPDLIVANERSDNVTILLGDGKGAFAPAPGSPFPAGRSPNDVALGDFNRDGRLDVAFANHQEKYLTVLLGDGRGGLVPAPRSPFAVGVRPHTHGVATGDFDGDGNLDLVTESWGTDQVEVLFGDGKGGFRVPGTFFSVGKHPYQRLRVADLNGDGKADIITTNLEGDDVTILLADGRGTFRQPPGSPFPCGDSPFNLAVGDVNGDGKPDLAIVNSPSSTSDRRGKDGLTILLGDGAGGFRMLAGSPFPTGRIPNRVAIGDVNGDGVNDVAVSSPDENNVTLFMMTRPGRVAATHTIRISGRPKGLAMRDLDGDGKADIVVTNSGDGTVTILLGTVVLSNSTER